MSNELWGDRMVSYLEFANLYQASDEEITRFMEKSGHLGLNVLNAFESYYKNYADYWDMAAAVELMEENHQTFFEQLHLEMCHKHDRERSYREETPENIRREASTMRDTIVTYRLWRDYSQSKNAAQFLEG